MNFTLIETKEDLAFLNQELLQRPIVGIDTEFRRTTRDNMKMSLLQINDSDEIFIVDAKLIEEPNNSCSFLSSLKVIKVLHSCKEDLEAIYAWSSLEMKNIYDTQLANAFLGGEFSASYQSLVKENIQIEIDKGETRSNWLRRPLTDSQLHYAASDVEYLLDIHEHQVYRLKEKKFWHNEEIEVLVNKVFDHNELNETDNIKLNKENERSFYLELDKRIKDLSDSLEINPTLLLSKKNQKILIKHIYNSGPNSALSSLSVWRKRLLEEHINEIHKELKV
tara:strand:+ start:40708 stop:41544 length:837 start_codon:yes stop_codon:yes gene_type:complete